MSGFQNEKRRKVAKKLNKIVDKIIIENFTIFRKDTDI